MRTIAATLMICLATLAAGCGTYHGLAEPRTSLAFVYDAAGPDRNKKLTTAATDNEIANLLDVNVKPKLPTRMAIARLASFADGYAPILGMIDETEMKGWSATVKDRKEVESVFAVSSLVHPSNELTLRSLRMAAARMDCELLLAYIQADSRVENRNYASVLYWTIVGLWVAPGHNLEHKTVMQAVLIDCRTGLVLGTATGDSHIDRICPYAFTESRQAQMAIEAPKNALTSLQKNTAAMLTKVLATDS